MDDRWRGTFRVLSEVRYIFTMFGVQVKITYMVLSQMHGLRRRQWLNTTLRRNFELYSESSFARSAREILAIFHPSLNSDLSLSPCLPLASRQI